PGHDARGVGRRRVRDRARGLGPLPARGPRPGAVARRPALPRARRRGHRAGTGAAGRAARGGRALPLPQPVDDELPRRRARRASPAAPDGFLDTQPLTASADGEYRCGDDPGNPESVRFDTIVDGRALRAWLSGWPYYRVGDV